MKEILFPMLKEEFRLHTALTNKYNFYIFPFFTVGIAFFMSLISKQILEEISLKEILLFLHLSILLYGLTAGSFAFLSAEFVERRFGQVKFLISLPSILPLEFKKTFLLFYLKEIIFYLCLTILPLTAGLLLGSSFSNFKIASILFLSFSLFLTFLVGISFSFFMYSVFIKNSRIFIAIVLSTLTIFISLLFLNLITIYDLIPFHKNFNDLILISLEIFSAMIFTILAYYFIEEKFESTSSYFESVLSEEEKKYSFTKYSIFVAKEFIDLKRSRTLTKIIFTFITPLVFLSFISWFLRSMQINIGFNTVFYGSMIGFFSVMIYSWLNIVDINDYYALLPITVSQIIRAKIRVFALLTFFISTFFVIAMSVLNKELFLLPLSLLLAFVISFYMVISTAYLTGLRTNTHLFNTKILMKFGVFAFVPQFLVMILSMGLNRDFIYSVSLILFICFILLVASFVIYQRIEDKWKSEEFLI